MCVCGAMMKYQSRRACLSGLVKGRKERGAPEWVAHSPHLPSDFILYISPEFAHGASFQHSFMSSIDFSLLFFPFFLLSYLRGCLLAQSVVDFPPFRSSVSASLSWSRPVLTFLSSINLSVFSLALALAPTPALHLQPPLPLFLFSSPPRSPALSVLSVCLSFALSVRPVRHLIVSSFAPSTHFIFSFESFR